jgi:hypothetical protein
VASTKSAAADIYAIAAGISLRYTIAYSPTGVTNAGWHALRVSVSRRGATVKARDGYQVDNLVQSPPGQGVLSRRLRSGHTFSSAVTTSHRLRNRRSSRRRRPPSVDVTVLDKKRQPVRDLKQEDFTILEDGKPQTIEAFAFVDVQARYRRRADVAGASSTLRRTSSITHASSSS